MERESLVKAAEELNEKFGLDPAIDVEVEDRELVTNVLEAAKLREPEDEAFTDETEAVLKELGSSDVSDETSEAESSKSESETKSGKEKKKNGAKKKETKVSSKKEKKAPKEKKEKKKEKEPSATFFITQKVCEHPNMTTEQIGEALKADGLMVNKGTLQVTVGGAKKTIAVLTSLGKLK